MRVPKFVPWLIAGTVVLIGGTLVASIVLDHEFADRAFFSVMLIFIHGVFAAACIALIKIRKTPRIAWITLCLGIPSLFAYLLVSWADPYTHFDESRLLLRFAATFTVLAIMAFQLAFVRLFALSQLVGQAIRFGAIGGAGLAGMQFMWEFWAGYFEIAIILFVLAAVLTLLTPVCWWIERLEKKSGEDTVVPHVPVAVQCPRCGARQTIPANKETPCIGCGLGFRLRIEEPRCECGYLLYGLHGDQCPECGRTVEHAWRNPESGGVDQAIGGGGANGSDDPPA